METENRLELMKTSKMAKKLEQINEQREAISQLVDAEVSSLEAKREFESFCCGEELGGKMVVCVRTRPLLEHEAGHLVREEMGFYVPAEHQDGTPQPTADTAVNIVSNAIHVIVLVVCVLVVPSLLGGLLISIFQAATQINEQMLSFLPRLLITLGMLVFAGHWILRTFSDLFIETFTQAGRLVG